uniref:52 kDa repressor of the inhibitor of the protein kinase-like isoform X2 n=1 Tax=Geotrypetes seraphini TaxID=260995 RepID=A0A6P8RJW4_GEOSA|nr:52 kDa repressor of the inhibitor of the protein kinase-like isoform X2 [Geotrypetes seraphini]
MPNYCAALNCSRKSTHSDIGFFRFPRDPARCKQWVENCQRVDLEDKTADHLNKCYRLCARHFDSSMVRRKSPYRTRLQDNAIPTIFDFRSHLTSPQSRRKRRIKEPVEEDVCSPISQWESAEIEPASDDEESALAWCPEFSLGTSPPGRRCRIARWKFTVSRINPRGCLSSQPAFGALSVPHVTSSHA